MFENLQQKRKKRKQIKDDEEFLPHDELFTENKGRF